MSKTAAPESVIELTTCKFKEVCLTNICTYQKDKHLCTDVCYYENFELRQNNGGQRIE